MTASPVSRSRPPDGVQCPAVDPCVSSPAQTPVTRTGYRHEALLFRGEAGFVESVGSFVRAGVERRETVILALPPERLAVLRQTLTDVEQIGARPDCAGSPDGAVLAWSSPATSAGRLLPSWQTFAQQWDGRPVRGVTEPMWSARREAEREECLLAEAMMNLAVPATVPLWLMCGYDTAAVPTRVLGETQRSHSLVRDGSAPGDDTTYTGAHHVAAVFQRALSTPVEPVRRLVVRPGNGAAVGDWVRRWATGWGLGQTRASRLAGALRGLGQACLAESGGDGAVLLLWQDGPALVAQLTAAVPPDQAGAPVETRVLLAPDSPLGAAVTRADDCCDLVQIRSGVNGTVVRLSNWL